MFLKSLTLKGFKSFAESTTLELEPGVTVVVGPNGSGKSNIVDAVAWVLGAQGTKALRSQKMDDVIFAGTANRPALGRAEVSLTIDNSAGLLPIEFTEVTITRTLFRSGDSEYALNGVPCRLLDIQELLSDSGVGRQQHVIVSQGNLDAILNARPEERRMVIEEAAGVLKFRRRRERAQRRLEATEGNLLRVQDLLREVRRQLRPLERQADAARRHGAVVGELRALRLHLAGRELSQLKTRAETLARTRAELTRLDGELKATLARLDSDVLAAEAAMSATGAHDLSDALVRHDGLRERARGLAAVLSERRRLIERQRTAEMDQTVVASLEADAAAAAAELDAVQAEAERLAPELETLVAAEAALGVEVGAFDAEWGDGMIPGAGAPSGEAAEVRGELAALRSAVERGRAERGRAESRLASLVAKGDRLGAEVDAIRVQLSDAGDDDTGLRAALATAEERRAVAEADLAAAEQVLAAAEGDRQAWSARADALALALDEARARAGAERLADVPGTVGTLLELVEVDEGWEAAFEAAIGEAIAAVVVDGVESARRALASLREGGTSGAVLALEAGGPPGSLDLATAAIDAEPVRAHVRSAHASVASLLDGLLRSAVCVAPAQGWEAALDLALAHPGLVAVTREGDRFAATGWRAGSGSIGATGAALEEAREKASAATIASEIASGRVAAAKESLKTARVSETESGRALDRFETQRAAAADALQRVEAERADVVAETDSLSAQLDELIGRSDRDEERVAHLEQLLPDLEAEEEAGAARVVAMQSARGRLDDRAAALRTLRRDLEVRAAGLEERRTLLTRRRAEIEQRLDQHVAERTGAAERRVVLAGSAVAVERLAEVVGRHLQSLEATVAELREKRRQQGELVRAAADRLDSLRRERAAVETKLAEARERAQRAELDDAEVRLRTEAATESLRRDFDCEPDVAIATDCPELPTATSADARARELDRELRLMGPINPLALEEHTALMERHTFLEGQLEDVKSSRRELAKVIRAVDAEIVEVFAAAYADVADNFTKLFSTLFPGGTGRLRLTDPDNLLETGIELEARPSGKNVKRLSLLSGGERSLTALAYLFAVFRSRPSPFYLMDEVEAALDDMNLHRFLDLVHEFRQEAQLLIVSHQKRTMEAADCLYGVTMQPGGSSKVVSERIAAGA